MKENVYDVARVEENPWSVYVGGGSLSCGTVGRFTVNVFMFSCCFFLNNLHVYVTEILITQPVHVYSHYEWQHNMCTFYYPLKSTVYTLCLQLLKCQKWKWELTHLPWT